MYVCMRVCVRVCSIWYVSQLRYHYLLLLEELVQTTEFNTEQHGRSELATALMRIEEGEVVEDRNKETIFRIRNLAPCLAAS